MAAKMPRGAVKCKLMKTRSTTGKRVRRCFDKNGKFVSMGGKKKK